MHTRRRSLLSTAAVLILLWTLPVHASEAIERFTFHPPHPPESTVDGKGPLHVVLNRWSTDAERDRVHDAMTGAEGTATVLNALRDSGNVGYIRWPGGLEYSLRYARRIDRADGTADVFLLADRPLWVWWEQAGVTPTTDYPFTLIQLRLGKEGTGEGRSSLTTTVNADKESGIALADFAKSAVVLNNVTREQRGT